MTDRNETLAEIVAEMREFLASCDTVIGGRTLTRANEVSRDEMDRFADRIEEAARLERIDLREEEAKMLLREYAKAPDETLTPSALDLKRELLAIANEAAAVVKQSFTTGNAAKLREALQSMIRQEQPFFKQEEIDRDLLCGRCTHSAIMFKDCKHDGSCWVDKVWDALSTPPRNCDRFDGDESAWEAYVAEHGGESAMGTMHGPDQADYPTWLFAPAAQEGGDHASK